jgi:hypothetical protein
MDGISIGMNVLKVLSEPAIGKLQPPYSIDASKSEIFISILNNNLDVLGCLFDDIKLTPRVISESMIICPTPYFVRCGYWKFSID